MAQLLTLPLARITDANGNPLSGALLYAYLTGTTTPTSAYTTSALNVAHANPVVADSAGLLPAIYLDPAVTYRFVAKTSAGASISGMDFDPVTVASAGDTSFSHDGTYAPGSVGEKLQRAPYITDAPYSADDTGAVDCTQAFQDAIDEGDVIFPPGDYTMSWAALSADVSIPGNRKITVQKGATITMTGGRFTAENVNNVEWQIDGWVKSVAMRTAPDKPAWTASTDERGFIEFAEDYVAASAANGFWVHGTGKVSGDWTGTPNVSDISTQSNRKGIASWNAANVLVEGIEVYGFDGEAVYAFFFDAASSNIVFQNLSVHDTRFNAINFNAGANGGGCVIRNNKIENAYQGIEISVGECSGNTVLTTINSGIFTGSGAGLGPLVIRGNTVKDAGSHSISVAFASGTPVTDVEVSDNTSITPSAYGIYCDYVRNLVVENNTCKGSGTGSGAYDIGINHTLRAVVGENKFFEPGGFAQVGNVAVATSFDVAVDPDSNVYVPTTGTVAGYVGNGVKSVASATAVTLPTLGSTFLITGTTNITSIVATGNAGRRVTLIFEGILTFTDGSNLKLAGNLVTTADDTITLICDGTNWFEVSRSVN